MSSPGVFKGAFTTSPVRTAFAHAVVLASALGGAVSVAYGFDGDVLFVLLAVVVVAVVVEVLVGVVVGGVVVAGCSRVVSQVVVGGA
ncbi:hypothetical protein BN000_05791 [Mycobacterium europaeum]|uniref:Transmembrane protein n=1 Tax=Mycobacterium europaeum TaxID=761804 RepID=A0A0U1DV49_9MYCO|nr:hypothetical protein BN000_05791 [Mycobacterium europaeum]